MNNTFLSELKNMAGNREIWIWGCKQTVKLESICDMLSEIGGFIDKNVKIETFMGKRVCRPSAIDRTKMFIYINLDKRYDEVKKKLNDNDYVEFCDYIYPADSPTVIRQSRGKYQDCYGNIIRGKVDGFSVTFKGIGSEIIIENDCHIDSSVKIFVFDGSVLKIGKEARIGRNAQIRIWSGANVEIGQKCCFARNLQMYCAHESSIQIRDRCTFGSNSFLEVGQNGDIKIGKDCMISSEVILQGCDSHLMFDIDTKAMLNAEKDYFIRLGEHVWMGKRSSALYGADIGSGSIVGMNGFVNKKIPNNVVIAGNPAKVVRENVAWSRQDAVSFQVQDMSEFDYR